MIAGLVFATQTAVALPSEGFETDKSSGEQHRTLFFDSGARALIVLPAQFNPNRESHLLIFALPNGNTIEQTIGCKTAPGLDWHFDIQHIAAQSRLLRDLPTYRDHNFVVAYVEADGLSWPSFRAKHGVKAAEQIAAIFDRVRSTVPGRVSGVTLAAHSGGGGFISSCIESADTISGNVKRIVFLDANYSFEAEKHAQKLIQWIKRSRTHELVVIAYDDRGVLLNGKRIVSDTGGTWRASMRMVDAIQKEIPLQKREPTDADRFPILQYSADQAHFYLHQNPEKKILHTRLVEYNGLLEAMTVGTPDEAKYGGAFFSTRAYEKYCQPTPSIPARRPDALGGKALGEKWLKLTADQRETAVATEVLKGNFPDFLRKTKTIRLSAEIDGKPHVCEIEVSSDYLSVGSNDDFLRIPLIPATAMKIATQLGCTLPTRRIVDAIDAAVEVKLEPKPLTESRETLATFIQHNQIIEDQRQGKPAGALICGNKKDIVLSNRLAEKPLKLAIYGWRKLDGTPIQPLTTVHKSTYVDYSHGVRLISRIVKVDGHEMLIEDVLKDPKLSVLLSDEGPVTDPSAFYRNDKESGAKAP
jgi:hypothetical protein